MLLYLCVSMSVYPDTLSYFSFNYWPDANFALTGWQLKQQRIHSIEIGMSEDNKCQLTDQVQADDRKDFQPLLLPLQHQVPPCEKLQQPWWLSATFSQLPLHSGTQSSYLQAIRSLLSMYGQHNTYQVRCCTSVLVPACWLRMHDDIRLVASTSRCWWARIPLKGKFRLGVCPIVLTFLVQTSVDALMQSLWLHHCRKWQRRSDHLC